MKLKKFKEKDTKRIGIIIFTITCILLVSGVILYRTFAIFEVKMSQNVIKGTVQDPGNIYFAFYVNDKIEKNMPQKNEGYIFDAENSYCGVTGEKDNNIKISLTEDWELRIRGVTSSRTKCNLKFVSGAYILGKPIKAVTNGNGLYEVLHNDNNGTIHEGFKQTEWRSAGANYIDDETPYVHNYIKFNDELWRIIGLVNVMANDNTVEQRIKIVKDTDIGKLYWDIATNDWTKASGMNVLNTLYFNEMSGECYGRSGNYCDFSSEGLNEDARKMIDTDITWNIGDCHSDATIHGSYVCERSTQVLTNDIPYIWNKNNAENMNGIGLLYASDIGYATSENRTNCFYNRVVRKLI